MKQAQRNGNAAAVEVSDESPAVYSNAAYATFTRHDLRLVFAELYRDPMGEYAIDKLIGRVAVTMSWTQAKALSGLLLKNIEDFEAKNGEIKDSELPG